MGLTLMTQAGAGAPAELPPAELAKALAVLMVDLVGAMPLGDRCAVLERLANRLDDRGRIAGGSEAVGLLGAVGAALMRMEA